MAARPRALLKKDSCVTAGQALAPLCAAMALSQHLQKHVTMGILFQATVVVKHADWKRDTHVKQSHPFVRYSVLLPEYKLSLECEGFMHRKSPHTQMRALRVLHIEESVCNSHSSVHVCKAAVVGEAANGIEGECVRFTFIQNAAVGSIIDTGIARDGAGIVVRSCICPADHCSLFNSDGCRGKGRVANVYRHE